MKTMRIWITLWMFALPLLALGQINMNIHLNNAPTVVIDMSDVDSVYYLMANAPSIMTRPATAISVTSAVSGGEIVTDSTFFIVERGILWSSSPAPSFADNVISLGGGNADHFSLISGLLPASTYYVVAYLITVSDTIYGNEVSFTTLIPMYTQGGGVTDPDGNFYETVIIGDQEWMAENLRTSKYANGGSIPLSCNSSVTAQSVHCWVDSVTTLIYGRFYNWDAVAHANNICPTGWHVPSNAEWMQLRDHLDPNAINDTTNVAGGMMKRPETVESGVGHWLSPNTDATNVSGFSALPGGWLNGYGTPISSYYFGAGVYGAWWTSTYGGIFGEPHRYYHITHDDSALKRNGLGIAQFSMFSVRCVKD